MTSIDLLRDAAEFTKKALKDVVLKKNTFAEKGYDEETGISVYKGYIPEKEGETKAVPYVLLQATNGADDDEKDKNECNIRFVFVLYFATREEGALGVLGVMERLRIALRKEGVLNKQYGIGKIEWLTYPYGEEPYYIGEMTVAFGMPSVKRTEEGIWEILNAGEFKKE